MVDPARRDLSAAPDGMPASSGEVGTGLAALARRYRAFAENEAAGSSPSLERWARCVAHDEELLARIATLPADKQQPNLVFAAARWQGVQAGDVEALRHAVRRDWDALRATILRRSTQTNEPARGAVLALGLARVEGPIALFGRRGR